MEMKCPFCGTQLNANQSDKIRKGIKILVVVLIIIFSITVVYFKFHQISDVPVLLSNSGLDCAIIQDRNNGSGGVIAVYGNITNNKPFDIVQTYIFITVNNSGHWQFFDNTIGSMKAGETRYFTWVHHFDEFNASLAQVEIDVQASRYL
jgi:hypothetical protein